MFHLKSFKLFEAVVALSDNFVKFKKALQNTDDLFKVDEISSIVEGELQGFEYDYFHRTVVPEWIKEHLNDMTYRGKSVAEMLNHFRNAFVKYLKEKNFDAQECFVSYEPGYNEEYESDNGTFRMAFDIFPLDEKASHTFEGEPNNLNNSTGVFDGDVSNGPGWACFAFKPASRFNNFNVTRFKGFESHDSGLQSGSGYESPISVTIDQGNGTFHAYKESTYRGPYKGLWDYFGSGAGFYTLKG